MKDGGKLTTSKIENSNFLKSSVAGFNWRNLEYPYLHNHSHWEIFLVIKGKVKHIINGTTQIATSGYACLLRPEDKHKLFFIDKSSETITYVFCEDIANKIISLYPVFDNLKQMPSPVSFTLGQETLDAVISKTLAAQFYPKHIYEQYVTLIINRLFSSYAEQTLKINEAYPQWLNGFLVYLRNPEHLRQPIPEIAKHSTYSYRRLSVLFKQYVGKTLVNYIKDLKITLAKSDLTNTNKTVFEIATDLNYESVSSLNHNFKKATGLSPSDFRKANKLL